jgi:hypothetical protein
VIIQTFQRPDFIFSPPDDSFAHEGAAVLCNDSALALVAVVFEVDHHPIAYTAEFVCSVGVGKQRCEVPAIFVAMEDWQPGDAPGIVALR